LKFSIVVAAYDVARYVDDFTASLEAQLTDHDDVEVLIVDDGSTDDTLTTFQAWAERSPMAVTVLTKENGGQASARNLGLEHATGEWVTFVDPDDVLREGYLSSVARMITAHPELHMVATNRLLLDDASGKAEDKHPLRWMFRPGDVVRDLSRDGSFFHGSAPAAFYRRSTLVETGLRFSLKVRPNFEDGHFSSRYLLLTPAPVVGFVKSARYLYRKRSDATSTLQTALTDPRRYTDVLRHGYLDALNAAREAYGAVPGWLQNFVLYELAYYFTSYERTNGAAVAPPERLGEFHELMGQIAALLDPEAILGYERPALGYEARMTLLHGYQEEPWVEEAVTVTGYDPDQRLARLSYYFTGELPDEEIEVDGEIVPPAYAKTRAIRFHDRVLLRERILWVQRTGPARVRLGGERRRVRTSRPTADEHVLTLGHVQRFRETPAWRQQLNHWPDPEALELMSAAGEPRVQRRYAEAWVLMDRVHNADDSAEHLFLWLRENRPEVNAWFVIEKGTVDSKRLRRAGHGRRLVDYGSREWKLLLLNATHLISSHADLPIAFPPGLEFSPRRPRFTFLQHGVIKDDLSRWLNGRPIDIFVTSTVAEHASVAGDDTTYRFSEREVVLSGLPRFDLVREAGSKVGPKERDLLLVAPTWRSWLVDSLERGSQRRELSDDVLTSQFVQEWTAFLTSDELHAAARAQGLQVAALMHPNLEALTERLGLPPSVRVLGFEGNDVRQLFARAAVLVTDYSSMAFNAAYIDRPVVYFQFDSERMRSGGHVGRAGYFDYARDGFGPVAATRDDAVAATVEALEHGRTPAPVYARRIADAFPVRDGRCRERVYDALVASTKPYERD